MRQNPSPASIDIPVDPVKGLLIHFPVADGAPLNNSSVLNFTDESFVMQSSGIDERSAAVQNTPQDTHRLSHLPPLNWRYHASRDFSQHARTARRNMLFVNEKQAKEPGEVVAKKARPILDGKRGSD